MGALAVALELGQGLVQQLLLLRSRAKPIQEIALLKFAEPLEDLGSLVRFVPVSVLTFCTPGCRVPRDQPLSGNAEG